MLCREIEGYYDVREQEAGTPDRYFANLLMMLLQEDLVDLFTEYFKDTRTIREGFFKIKTTYLTRASIRLIETEDSAEKERVTALFIHALSHLTTPFEISFDNAPIDALLDLTLVFASKELTNDEKLVLFSNLCRYIDSLLSLCKRKFLWSDQKSIIYFIYRVVCEVERILFLQQNKNDLKPYMTVKGLVDSLDRKVRTITNISQTEVDAFEQFFTFRIKFMNPDDVSGSYTVSDWRLLTSYFPLFKDRMEKRLDPLNHRRTMGEVLHADY